MTAIQQLSLKNIKLLKKSSTPMLDVEVILSFVLKKTKEFLYTHPEYKLTKNKLTKFNKLINRRLKNEPIAYIIGEKEFYGLKFLVNKNTLIPRPATEILVEAALQKLLTFNFQLSTLIDLGTGSGCIPIAIAKNIRKKINIYAIDNSLKALNIAKKNARLHSVDKKIKFIKSDLLNSPLTRGARGVKSNSNLIITANLPYISTSQYKTLSSDIKKYEPKQALIAGQDGLKYYKKLFKQIKHFNSILDRRKPSLPPAQTQRCPTPSWGWDPYQPYNTTLLIEIDPRQATPIKKILKKDFKNVKIKTIKDLAGLNRIMIINL